MLSSKVYVYAMFNACRCSGGAVATPIDTNRQQVLLEGSKRRGDRQTDGWTDTKDQEENGKGLWRGWGQRERGEEKGENKTFEKKEETRERGRENPSEDRVCGVCKG